MPQPPWHLNPNAPLDMDGQKITNLAAGVAADDAATVAQAGGGGGVQNPMTSDLDTGGFSFTTSDAGGIPIVTTDATGDDIVTITAPAGYHLTAGNGYLLRILAGDGTEVLSFDPSGSLFIAGAAEEAPVTSQLHVVGSQAGEASILNSGHSSSVTADRFNLAHGDALIFRISGTGVVLIGATTAPANAEILSSSVGLYFDPTNGAGALKLKGKTANGTVVTATIPMAHVQMLGWITEPPDGAAVRYDQANRALTSAQQTALADLNLGTLTLLTEAITAIGTMQTKINSLLAKLRTAGVLAP